MNLSDVLLACLLVVIIIMIMTTIINCFYSDTPRENKTSPRPNNYGHGDGDGGEIIQWQQIPNSWSLVLKGTRTEVIFVRLSIMKTVYLHASPLGF